MLESLKAEQPLLSCAVFMGLSGITSALYFYITTVKHGLDITLFFVLFSLMTADFFAGITKIVMSDNPVVDYSLKLGICFYVVCMMLSARFGSVWQQIGSGILVAVLAYCKIEQLMHEKVKAKRRWYHGVRSR